MVFIYLAVTVMPLESPKLSSRVPHLLVKHVVSDRHSVICCYIAFRAHDNDLQLPFIVHAIHHQFLILSRKKRQEVTESVIIICLDDDS